MKRKSILIVDDEQVMLEVFQRILTRLGYRIAICNSWKSALDVFSRKPFDLVLMDILIPPTNGYKVARKMRQLNPHQKIVMVTGLGAFTASAYNASTKVQVNDILFKPFTYEKLKSVVNSILI